MKYFVFFALKIHCMIKKIISVLSKFSPITNYRQISKWLLKLYLLQALITSTICITKIVYLFYNKQSKLFKCLIPKQQQSTAKIRLKETGKTSQTETKEPQKLRRKYAFN